MTDREEYKTLLEKALATLKTVDEALFMADPDKFAGLRFVVKTRILKIEKALAK